LRRNERTKRLCRSFISGGKGFDETLTASPPVVPNRGPACCVGRALLVPAGCVGGFGRIARSHDWIGPTAFNGEPASNVPLTSDEGLLRDLAYPLITQPSEQGRIGAVAIQLFYFWIASSVSLRSASSQ
jgi:hypothetical protein